MEAMLDQIHVDIESTSREIIFQQGKAVDVNNYITSIVTFIWPVL